MTTYSSSDETRMSLINATGEMVLEYGANNVSTRAIAERAGVNIGSIHYHFGSKEDLLKAMVDTAVDDNLCAEALMGVIDKYDSQLNTPLGQISFIRELVSRHVQHICLEDDRYWHSKVIYQMVHRHNPLQEYLFEEHIKPRVLVTTGAFQRIRPDWAFNKALSVYTHMIGTVIFQFDMKETILQFLKEEEYPGEYIREIEEMIVRTLLNELGLLPGNPDFADAEEGR